MRIYSAYREFSRVKYNFFLFINGLTDFFFTERSQRGVILYLGDLLAQVINPFFLIKITPLETSIGEKLALQVGSLPTSFLLSLVIVAGSLLSVEKLNSWKLYSGQVRFKIEYSIILSSALFLLNDTAKEFISRGDELTGINITTWVCLPLVGVLFILWPYFKWKRQVK